MHPEETWECDWLSGCFLMVRREAIEEVGRFDEGYRKYFEDVDICLRMARAGWQVMYHGATSCYHLESRSSKRLLLVRRLDRICSPTFAADGNLAPSEPAGLRATMTKVSA